MYCDGCCDKMISWYWGFKLHCIEGKHNNPINVVPFRLGFVANHSWSLMRESYMSVSFNNTLPLAWVINQ